MTQNQFLRIILFNLSDICRMDTVTRKSTKTIVELAPEHAYREERQVLIKVAATSFYNIRIWPSTFLICNQTGQRSRLLFCENIARFPNWSSVTPGMTFYLIFEGLPKNCLTFDLHEIIPEANGFYFPSILRNKEDVYHLEV